MRFSAALQGIDVDKAKGSEGEDHPIARSDKDDLTFKSPDDYKNMPAERRRDLTQKMLSKFKTWAKDPLQMSKHKVAPEHRKGIGCADK
jgi:hypothetical protein